MTEAQIIYLTFGSKMEDNFVPLDTYLRKGYTAL